jgi:hypothetical protein
MRARVRLPWLLVATLLAMLACDPDLPPTRFYDEDFETLCDGTPCGWERTSGDETQATWIETIHPGEHGLRLEGQASVRGTNAGATTGDAFAVETLSVELTARCDLGSQLRVDLVLADEFGETFIASALAAPEAAWSPPPGVTVVTDAFAARAARVTAVGIAKTGPGACEISAIAIDSVPLPTGC